MTKKHKVIAIVAGEHSGDSYGAMIISNLKSLYPDSKFIGVGGKAMIEQGLQPFMPMEILSVVGIFNVIKKLPSLLIARKNVIHSIINSNADIFIGVDAPEFNLSVARGLSKARKKLNIDLKIIQYISPTVWVWRPNRIYTIDKYTDMVLCIFPFEKEIYQSKNISAEFVGHPLANKLHAKTRLDKARSLEKILTYSNSNLKNTLEVNNSKVIGVYPGSRRSELHALSRPFIDTLAWLNKQDKNYIFVVSLVNQKLAEIWQNNYDNYIRDTKQELPIICIHLYKKNYEQSIPLTISSIDIMQAADLILCSSGTTTLESLLVGTPMVVAYKISLLNALLIKLLIKVKYVAMSNILSDRLFGSKLVPEFLQNNVTAENLGTAILTELEKYNPNNIQSSLFSSKWREIQNYLKSANINHDQAVTSSIQGLLSNE